MKPLNPSMAAFLAASAAAFALPGTSFANCYGPNCQATSPTGKATIPSASASSPSLPPMSLGQSSTRLEVASCSDKQKDETDPRNAMTCLVATHPEARKDIGARFAAFVQGKDAKGGDYLTDGLRKDEKFLPAALKEAQDWPEKNKDKPADIAILYFVLGPGDGAAPSWLQGAPVLAKTFTGSAKLKERLETSLAGAKWTGTKKIPQTGAPDAVDAFLIDAVARAYKVFDDPRSRAEIKASIEANDTTAPVAPTVGESHRSPLDGTGSGFSFDDMYVNGAVVQKVWGSKDDGFRTISMKMYTIKQPDGSLQNMIGIVDITPGDPNSPYAPKFVPMTQSGDSDLSLRDGGRKYKISIGVTENGEHTVSFSRPGGQALSTSMEKLATARADQAAGGGIVSIGGQQFYALAQGGTNGSVLFFPKDDVDNRASTKDARYLRPVAMGNVSKVDADGLTVPMDGKPDIGKINGSPYHLEWDNNLKIWKVATGEGDKPAPPPAPAGTAAAPAAKPAGAPQADDQTTDDQTGAPAATDVTGASTLEQALALAAKTGWTQTASNKELSDEARAKIRITTTLREGHRYFNVFFDPSFGVPGNQYAFALTVGNQPLKNVRGVKNFVVLEYPNAKQYFSYTDLAAYVQQKQSSPVILDPKIGMQNVTDLDMAMDMLTHYFDLTQAEKDKLNDPKDGLRARVAAHKKGDGYVINGNGKLIYMNTGEEGLAIWPAIVKSGDKGDNSGMTGLRGPGTAVSVVGGGPSEFKKEMEMPGGRHAQLVKGQDHIALYTGKEDEAMPDGKMKTADVWYVMTDYLKGAYTGDAEKDKKAASPARTKPLPMFGGQDRMKLPNGYQMSGLTEVVLPDTAQFMLLHGSTQEKGAIAAYRFVLPDAQGGQNAKDKAGNCGGPVIWWGGVTKEQVQKACETDSKIP